ncbi:MAG: hypothetical protein JST86_01880 [Bacteroidetes bacterium]|nr:hypothetical protein [Bacteroidota bacterium]
MFKWLIIAGFTIIQQYAFAQKDTALLHIPVQYVQQVDAKMEQYTQRITHKTTQTLTHLARWEAKIKSLLEKASPETAQRLFGNNQLTFAAALEKYKRGEKIIAEHRAQYNTYTDRLTTSLAYLEQQKDSINTKLVAPVKKARQKAAAMQEQEEQTDAMVTFIKERRKQLLNQASQYIMNSKWMHKITGENYTLVMSLKNYRELFQDSKKAEQAALQILRHIKGFNTFFQNNSMLAQLFGSPLPTSPQGGGAALAGLQTRASVNNLIQTQIASAGPGAAAQIRQNMQDAQAQLSALKDKVMKAGGESPDADLPAPKRFNEASTKTFLQRLHPGADIAFVKDNTLLPNAANITASVAYQISDKNEVAVGTQYRMGFGSINRLQFSNQSIGIRTGTSLQLKKSFWATAEWDAYYNTAFKNIAALRNYSAWTQTGLVGIEKRLNIKTRLTKGTKFTLLWDPFAHAAVPTRQQFVFRVGYNFK